MKIAVIIFAALGTISSAWLGLYWRSSFAGLSREELDLAMAMARTMGESDVSGVVSASYLLLLCAVAGIAAIVLVSLKREYRIAAPLMLVTAILPVLFQTEAAIGTALMAIGGILATVAFLRSRRTSALVSA